MQVGLGVAYQLAADWPAPHLRALVTSDNGFLHVRFHSAFFFRWFWCR